MKISFAIGLVIWLVFASVSANAKIYKWKDENGKTHFTNDPTRVPKTSNVETFRELLPPAENNEPRLPSPKELPEIQKKGTEEIVGDTVIEKDSQIETKTLKQKKESYQKLVRVAEEARARQLKKIEELKEMGHKPDSWTTKESLEEIIEGLEKSVERLNQKIQNYKEKIKDTRVQD